MAGCSSTSGGPTTTTSHGYPSSIVVLGHSGATGRATDANSPVKDVPQNSWATGDNPAVNSIYLRLLAVNPGVRGHAANIAVDGTRVDQLDVQAQEALRVKPLPDLFLIQTVDNDIRCDGSDPANYAPFTASLTRALQRITHGAPHARIFVIGGLTGSVESRTQVLATIPEIVNASGGDGPCDTIDPTGRIRKTGIVTLNGIVHGYQVALASACAKIAQCRSDGGALSRMVVTANDLAVDHVHLSIAGQRKLADLEWTVLALNPEEPSWR